MWVSGSRLEKSTNIHHLQGFAQLNTRGKNKQKPAEIQFRAEMAVKEAPETRVL